MSCNGDCNQGRECNCKCKMTKDEALRMAIKWITDVSTNNEDEVIQACTEALAETQEPVAWMNDIAFSMDKELLGTRSRIVPLYTTPPSREWVGLSDEEIWDIANFLGKNKEWDYPVMFAKTIERALREKNG